MALASASHGAGGGSRIADFWRISAVFDPIRGGPEPRTADQIQLAGIQIRRASSRWPVIWMPGFFPDIVAGKLS